MLWLILLVLCSTTQSHFPCVQCFGSSTDHCFMHFSSLAVLRAVDLLSSALLPALSFPAPFIDLCSWLCLWHGCVCGCACGCACGVVLVGLWLCIRNCVLVDLASFEVRREHCQPKVVVEDRGATLAVEVRRGTLPHGPRS